MTKPEPHSAILKLTGWPAAADGGIILNKLFINTSWVPPETPARVTVTCWPRTDRNGVIKHLEGSGVRAATRTNGARWRVVGHLLQLNRTSGVVRIEVLPQRAGVPPFTIYAHAVSAVLNDERFPEAVFVEATGRLLAGQYFLLESMRPVLTHTHSRWKLKRRQQKKPLQSKNRP